MVADAHGGDIRAYGFDDARSLMSEHEGLVGGVAPEAVDDVQIGMANAGRGGADEHFPPPWLVDVHLLDGQGLVHFAEHGGGDGHGGSLRLGERYRVEWNSV